MTTEEDNLVAIRDILGPVAERLADLARVALEQAQVDPEPAVAVAALIDLQASILARMIRETAPASVRDEYLRATELRVREMLWSRP